MVSIIIRLLILAYTIILFKKLIMHEGDKNSTIESTIKDRTMITNVSLADTGVNLNLVIINSKYDKPISFDHESMFKYIRVRAATITKDQSVYPPTEKYSYTNMRLCTIDDFNRTPSMREIWEDLFKTKQPFLCPEEPSSLRISGQPIYEQF